MNTVLLNNPCSKIGMILKAYRERLDLKQSQIAQKAAISTSMLSQIERGVVFPSIDTLYNVCKALGVNIAHLFSTISEKDQVRVYHQGERLTTRAKGAFYEQLAVSIDTAHAGEIFLLEIAPGREIGLSGKGHLGAEMGYVLSGTATLVVNEKEYLLEPHDSISFNAELPHKLKNTGQTPFRAIWNALPPHRDYLEIEKRS